MSDIVERTRQAMALTGHGRVGEILMLVPELVAEVERLREDLSALQRLVRNPRVVAAIATIDPNNAVEVEVLPPPADEGDQPLGEKPAVTRDDILAQGPW